MKHLIMIFSGIIALLECYGQRYEVWVKTNESRYNIYGNLAHFNDSVLTVYSNPTIFTLSKDKNFQWEEITALKVRNKSLHQFGFLLGTAIGSASALYFDKKYEGENFMAPFFIGIGLMGGGMLTGHLLTSAKISIPLDGKTATEKSQAFKNSINKRR